MTLESVQRDFRWILESEDGSRALMVTYHGNGLCLFYCAAFEQEDPGALIVDNWLDEDQATILTSDNEDLPSSLSIGIIDGYVRRMMPTWLSDFQADEVTELSEDDE